MAVDPKSFAGTDKKFFVVQKAAGINTQAKRESIRDEQWSWLENLQPIGDGNYRALYSNGSSIYTAPAGKTIIYYYFFNVGATTYVAVFLSDGTADSVNTVTQVVTHISTNPGDFFPGSSALGNPAPQCAQFGQSGIIIVTTASTNGYYAWDGATLTGPGQAAPNWLTNTTPTTMPTGISGTCVETFASRVWVGFGAEFFNSAPGNGADFSGADGGGVTPSSDSFLRREFTALRQSSSFIYLFADSSVNVVSNVQSAGSPVVTTFNNQNVDPQVGTPWHNSVQAFGRGLVFANSQGVFTLVGGSAEKVSDDLDGIFAAATATLMQDATIAQPSSAIITLNDIKVYMLLVPVQGPLDTTYRNALVMWDGKKWWVGSQVSSLTFIGSQEINSVLDAWGTDGTHIFPLFTSASASLTKTWQTKQAMRLYTMGVDNSGTGYTFSGTLDFILENAGQQSQNFTVSSSTFPVIWQNALLQTVQWQNSTPANVNFTVPGPTLTGSGSINANVRGNYLGMTVHSTSSDFTLIMQSLLYQEQSPLGA